MPVQPSGNAHTKTRHDAFSGQNRPHNDHHRAFPEFFKQPMQTLFPSAQ